MEITIEYQSSFYSNYYLYQYILINLIANTKSHCFNDFT